MINKSAAIAFSASALAIASAVSFSQAATITWGSVQDSVAETDVNTTGTLSIARNFGASGAVTTTANGVTFTYANPSGWASGGFTNGLSSAPSAPAVVSTSGSVGYDNLLTSGIGPGGGTSNPTAVGAFQLDSLVAGGFTPGNTYLIQVWYTDQRDNSRDREMVLSSVDQTIITSTGLTSNAQINSLTANTGSVPIGPTSGALEADPNNTVGTTDTIFGSYITGTWTADSNQLYLLAQGSNPTNPTFNLRAQLNGFQIRDLGVIPEPSAALLAGLGLLGLLRRRRA